MIHSKKITVVLPAYNAEKTLRRTVEEIPRDIVDEIILGDDFSHDDTVAVAESLDLVTLRHDRNRGYGANQKTCFNEALHRDADVIVMLHPDYQYSPLLVPAMASMVAVGQYDIVLGSRVLGRGALRGGMPLYKYVANRALTAIENVLLDRKLSEYHTGYRAFSRGALQRIPYSHNSDDFIFDNQILAQAVHLDMEIGELSCPARYQPDASSINPRRAAIYGAGVLSTAVQYRLVAMGLGRSELFPRE